MIKQIYGFIPNFLFSPRRNALDYILSCPLSLIQCWPRNLEFHNLCDTKVVPKTLCLLFGLGLNFNIQPPGSSFASFDLERFLKGFDWRCMFSNAPPDAETAALGWPAHYKTNPDWKPDLPVSPDLLWRRSNFDMSIRLLFSNHRRNQTTNSNLLPNQEAAMKWLLNQNDISILNADKSLGPVVKESTKYIHLYIHLASRDHLSNESTYRRLTCNEVNEIIRHSHQNIIFFLEANQKSLHKSGYNYISRCTIEKTTCIYSPKSTKRRWKLELFFLPAVAFTLQWNSEKSYQLSNGSNLSHKVRSTKWLVPIEFKMYRLTQQMKILYLQK